MAMLTGFAGPAENSIRLLVPAPASSSEASSTSAFTALPV
jgi:hypothetical protein